MGRYFEWKMNAHRNVCDSIEYPISSFEYLVNERIIYDVGYCVVKPVIDRHGTDGMLYMMQNPPSVTDVMLFPAYTNSVLVELGKK